MNAGSKIAEEYKQKNHRAPEHRPMIVEVAVYLDYNLSHKQLSIRQGEGDASPITFLLI